MASFQQEHVPLVPEIYEPISELPSQSQPSILGSHKSFKYIITGLAITTCVILIGTLFSSSSSNLSTTTSTTTTLTLPALSHGDERHHGHGHGHEHEHEHDSKHGHTSHDSSSHSHNPDSTSQPKHHSSPSSTITLPSTTPECKSSPLNSQHCDGPWPGYPYCEAHMNWMLLNWNATPNQEAFYRAKGVDGTKCSILLFLHNNGFYCPAPVDLTVDKIRGVNLGGWLVLEPWIKPSLFTQFHPKDNVVDQWKFCEVLGKQEATKQLENHYATWLTEKDVAALASGGINHVRIPVGYWIMGDINDDEPWVDGGLKYLETAMKWFIQYRLHVVLDLHCAPGSQNGFDNSGRKGTIHFADTVTAKSGRVLYPNVERTLRVLSNLTQHFSKPEYKQVVVAIELVNEAFISIPIEVVKDFYLRGYQVVRSYNDQLAVVIGDSFRFGAWGDFMFPPHYEHVWIDTHIYQCFDQFRLGMTWADHLHQTCQINKPEVAIAPLSTMVGEWSLATTDCAKWLNGYGAGSRYDGTFPDSTQIGSCDGYDDVTSSVYTDEFKAFLREFAEKQMDAYESGSSAGWFFWNFKTEEAPEWNYILGLEQGWIPKDHSKREFKCEPPTTPAPPAPATEATPN